MKSGSVPESFENFTSKRKNLILKLKLSSRELDKIEKMLNLEYLIEFYIGEALSEKTMNSYNRLLNDNHTKVIEDLIKSPDNLKIIMEAITRRDCDFVNFMLEILYVIESIPNLFKKLLETFRKCGMDKYLINTIIKTNIETMSDAQSVTFRIKESRPKIKCLTLFLNLFLLTLNKNNPSSLEFFFSEKGNLPFATQLTTKLIQFICQKEHKLIAICAENILDNVLRNWQNLEAFGEFSQETVDIEKNNFISLIVSICRDMRIHESPVIFKIINIFALTKSQQFVYLFDQQFDTLKILKDNLDCWKFSKDNISTLFTFLSFMTSSGVMENRKGHDILILVSHFKKKLEMKKRTSNMIYSKILAFEKNFSQKYNSCVL